MLSAAHEPELAHGTVGKSKKQFVYVDIRTFAWVFCANKAINLVKSFNPMNTVGKFTLVEIVWRELP